MQIIRCGINSTRGDTGFLRLRASFTSFGQLLHSARKRIVNIMKVYMESNNMQVEFIRLRNIDLIDAGNFEMGIYFRKVVPSADSALFRYCSPHL